LFGGWPARETPLSSRSALGLVLAVSDISGLMLAEGYYPPASVFGQAFIVEDPADLHESMITRAEPSRRLIRSTQGRSVALNPP
jgi:hypothetical protein